MNSLKIRDALELLGIVGVIASLIFVGFEIQQNSAIARVEAQRGFANDALTIIGFVMESPALSEAMAVLVDDRDFDTESLSAEQEVLLVNYYAGILYTWEAQYDAYRAGVLELEELHFINDTSTLNNDVVRETWDYYKTYLIGTEFAVFLEINNLIEQ